ncbi:hypothetical protein DDE01_04130 [Desulfovibrio desulfuricans]|nr:hypothetical protein DDE01_04130 [Desulfovibrio desulfuricans]
MVSWYIRFTPFRGGVQCVCTRFVRRATCKPGRVGLGIRTRHGGSAPSNRNIKERAAWLDVLKSPARN